MSSAVRIRLSCLQYYEAVYDTCTSDYPFNSLAPGRPGFSFKSAISNIVLLIGIFRSSYDNGLRWMSFDLPEDKSVLVQVMAWCPQATSHYLSQCWPRSKPPYCVTRPQWVKTHLDRNEETIHFYIDVTWALWCFKSPGIRLDCVFNKLFSLTIKETSNLYFTGPLWPVESRPKVTATWKSFAYHGVVIMKPCRESNGLAFGVWLKHHAQQEY